MDAQKLFRILKDLQKDEQTLTIGTRIDEIRNNIAQNNQGAFDLAQTQLNDTITQIREGSISYNFSRTEIMLLKQVGGESYFGKGLIAQLETIFAARSFEIVGKVNEYDNQRKDFMTKAQRLAAGFGDMGIEEYRPSLYEVGLVIPEDEADLDKLARRIKDLKLLLSGLVEIAGEDQRGVKITRLSSGSLELFSLQPAEVAVLLSTLLLNVSAIWDKIAQFRKKIDETEKSELLSSDSKKSIKEIWENEAKKIKNEILEELPERCLKKFKKQDQGRKNEIRNQISISIQTIFAWLEIGIEVDITPVRVDNPDGVPDQEVGQIAMIQETNAKLQEIYKLPKELKQLPFKLPKLLESDTEEETK